MDLLFRRAQTTNSFTSVTKFQLHAKAEFTNEEDALLRKYDFKGAILIHVEQPGLFRNAVIVAFLCFVVLTPFIAWNFFREIGLGWTGVYMISAGLSVLAGFFFYHQMRETLYVRDLIHGRDFRCRSVIDLARKEAWIESTCAFLRQVLEAAKHWDGQDRREILPVPKDEARRVILKGL